MKRPPFIKVSIALLVIVGYYFFLYQESYLVLDDDIRSKSCSAEEMTEMSSQKRVSSDNTSVQVTHFIRKQPFFGEYCLKKLNCQEFSINCCVFTQRVLTHMSTRQVSERTTRPNISDREKNVC